MFRAIEGELNTQGSQLKHMSLAVIKMAVHRIKLLQAPTIQISFKEENILIQNGELNLFCDLILGGG